MPTKAKPEAEAPEAPITPGQVTITEHNPPTVVQALNAARLAIGAVGKDSQADQRLGGYRFRGVDAVVNATSRVLAEHGILVTPEVLAVERATTESRSGASMLNVYVTTRFTFHGPAGDSVSTVVMGEAADAGDKATTKAQSVALRVALLQTLLLPTDEPDPDSEGYERAGAQRAAEHTQGRAQRAPQREPEGEPPAHVQALEADLEALTPDQQAWMRANWPAGYPGVRRLTVSQAAVVREVLAKVPPA